MRMKSSERQKKTPGHLFPPAFCSVCFPLFDLRLSFFSLLSRLASPCTFSLISYETNSQVNKCLTARKSVINVEMKQKTVGPNTR